MHYVQLGGAGPTRLKLMTPDNPLLDPPEKVKVKVAAEQLWNAIVPVPTATVFWPGGVCVSNSPPVVWKIVTGMDRIPGVKVPWAVYQRCPAAPAAAPFGKYVYQPKRTLPKLD